MSTIRTDVADTETPASEYDATAGFLARLGGDEDEDAREGAPSEPGDEDLEDEAAHDDNEDDAEGSDEDRPDTDDEDDQSGTDEEDEKAFADEGAYVKLKVDGKDQEVPVKDLTRLYGQEAALTRKSQEVAEQRRVADANAQKYVASLNVLVQRAAEKVAPYQNIDWLAESRNPNISQEEFAAIRADAQRAMEEHSFLTQNLDAFMGEVSKQQNAARVESAKACVQALTTPGTDDKPNPHFIEGWSDQTYDAVRAFGVSMGMPAEAVNGIVDASAIKMMHMAMQFAKGAKKVQTTKVNKTPKKIVKTSSAPAARPAAAVADRKVALSRLRKNGNDTEAAVSAFMSGMGDDD